MATPFAGHGLKARVIRDLVAAGRPITVLDYGAGTGVGWSGALGEGSPITLYAYEPHEPYLPQLRSNLQGRATVWDRAGFEATGLQADVILSFSVVQQLMDKETYFREAKKRLAPDGRFIVVYDDGFWRLSSLFEPSQKPSVALRQLAINALAPVFRRLRRWERYRERVTEAGFEALARRHGFRVSADLYGNLESFKGLWKRIAPEHQDAFMALWIETEERLNAMRTGFEFAGHRSNLWAQCLSRACILDHAPADQTPSR